MNVLVSCTANETSSRSSVARGRKKRESDLIKSRRRDYSVNTVRSTIGGQTVPCVKV